MKIVYRSRIEYLSLQTELNHTISEDLDYYAGLQAINYGIAPGELDPMGSAEIFPVSLPKENSYEFSGYGNLNWKPNDWLAISAGLRLNHFLLSGPYTAATFDPATKEIIETKTYDSGETASDYTNLEPRLGLAAQLNKRQLNKGKFCAHESIPAQHL